MDPIEKVWDLTSDKIFISKRLLSRIFTELAEGEEINISYGERANSFLIVEYGFAQENNRYDFVRLNGIGWDKLRDVARDIGVETVRDDDVKERLKSIKMKEVIRCDLKLSGLHRDLLKMIRCIVR